MRTSNVVTWFEIYVDDMARAKKFYEAVLGDEMTDMAVPEGYGGEMACFPFVEGAPNTSGALVKHESGKPGDGGTLIYFACKDCAEEIGRVEAAGGKVIAPKFSIGDYGFCGIALDTEGNSIGFHSMS
jgi:hypothetical protein